MEGKSKEEYMISAVEDAMAVFGSLSPGVYGLVKQIAEARAERDAAREKGHQSWMDGVDSAISVLDGKATGVGAEDREWSKQRTESLLSARKSIITASALRAKLDELKAERDGWRADANLRANNEAHHLNRADAAEKRVAELEAERDALKARPLAALPGYTIDSIRAFDGEQGRYVEATIGLPREGGGMDWYELTSAQPSPAPVVGGVTEAHIDAIEQGNLAESKPAEAEGPFEADTSNLFRAEYYGLWERHKSVAKCQTEDDSIRLARLANLGHAAEQGKLVRPPETREEMLCEFLRLAIELGDEKPIVFDQVCACPATAWEERERVLRPFVRAHLAKKQEAAK